VTDAALIELVGTLRMLDVRLAADGDALHYDAPPDVMTGGLLTRVRDHKAALLRRLSDEVPPVERSGPATFAQRRMYHQYQASTRPAVFNVALRIPIAGPLDPGTLGRALTALTRRQRALRSRLIEYGTDLVQEVVPTTEIPLPVIDLRGAAAAIVDDHVRKAAARPFELNAAPLLRAVLLRTGDAEWTLCVVVHHIVIDGWGLTVLLAELAALYAAAPARGLPDDTAAGLAPLTAGYTDVGRQERAYLSGGRIDELRAFWRDRLAGAPVDLSLPYDRPRPARLSGRGEVLRVHIPGELTARADALARERGTTMFVVLLTALGVLLGRLSGQPEVVVACNVANRRRREHEGLVGLFANNVAVRIPAGGGGTFAALLAATGQAFFAGVDHQDYPLGMLAEDLAPRLAAEGAHFPKVIVSMQNQLEPVLRLPGLDTEVHDVPISGAKTDLTVALAYEADGIAGLLEYSTDVFAAATIARWGASYVDLLRRAVDDPAGPLGTGGNQVY
jgi:hypothetical protein